MGTFVGHALPGLGFLLIGLWHLINHIKAHSINPNSRTFHPWFPTPFLRHLELLLIMLGCTISIALELVTSPRHHQAFDPDWTIPSRNLRNFEHALISFSLFIYAAFAIVLDRMRPRAYNGLTHLLAAAAFAQELLLFYLHSADHTGIEGQYHFLLQIIVIISLVTTLTGIGIPNSFLISFVRSLSIFFQGLWLIVMGYMLWTPRMVPKGCRLDSEVGHLTIRCTGHGALIRAKSLVNVLFSWCFIWVTIFSVALYLVLLKQYEKKVEYRRLDGVENDNEDDECQTQQSETQQPSFVHMGKVELALMDIER